tara:strand:- start:1529 stop:5380 length:3852 start_codon:yes stop_codon:yes gene_type:complete
MKQFTIKALLAIYSALVANLALAAIAQVPLHVSTTADPNVLFNMSVESPMGGAAYNDQPGTFPLGNVCDGRITQGGGEVGVCYFKTETYLGYFNPTRCYAYQSGVFVPTDKIHPLNHCNGVNFSGNFMNWASMTAIDMFVGTMTGGNRVVDTSSRTVIQRMRKHNNDNWFPIKYLGAAHDVNVAPSNVGPWTSESEVYITNTDWGIQFGTSRGGDQLGSFNLKVQVCNSAVGLESNCKRYGSYYKPEGLVQKNANNMRFAATSFSLNTNADGGVLRSNMKYVGPNMPDGNGGLIANPLAEFDSGGLLLNNPNASDATASGVSNSGVINYLNKFSDAGYKSRDPAGELFYESIRYFKNLGRTPEYSSVLSTSDLGGFPAITSWQDPIQYSCQKNFILGINDANPWHDKKLPGTHFTSATFNGHTLTGYDIDGNGTIEGDYGEPSNPDTSINVRTLTNRVGELEGLNGTNQRIGCTTSLCPENGSGALNDTTAKHMAALGEVMGTSPAPQKENSYYIAGLAFYANTTDIRNDFAGKQTISTFMVDTQEYGTDPLTGQMNMLWLAGKYGGFIDADGDNVPDAGEWDSETTGEPDNYVLASRPDKLVTALGSNFSNIQSLSSSSTAVTASSTRLNTDTQAFQASFSSADWSGTLTAHPVLANGALGSKTWDASFPTAVNRNVYSWSGTAGFAFDTTNRTTVLAAALSMTPPATPLTDDQINYLRGDQSQEAKNSGILRDRATLLGDIVNSNPRFVGTDDYGFSRLAGSEGTGYKTFRETSGYLSRNKAIYVGANDGMLHGFNAATGLELFGYIPRAVYGNLAALTEQGYDHRYFVDGTPDVSDAYLDLDGAGAGTTLGWKTVLVNTLGAGGKGVFGLDITTPGSFAGANVYWEIAPDTLSATSTLDFANLGVTVGEASIARMANGQWAAIFANGYESASGESIIYVVDLRTGALIKEFNTHIAGSNGMGTPVVIDADGDLSADTIYVGDLKGNLWKIDVSSSSSSNWNFAFYNENDPSDLTDDVNPPLFVAQDGVAPGNPQPITAKPQVGRHPKGGVMVYFGTGKYFETQDNVVGNSPKVQSFYGIWDQNLPVEGDRDAALSAFKLVEQTIDRESVFSTDFDVRVTSKNTLNYITTPTNTGWYMDLKLVTGSAKGERVVNGPLLRGGRVFLETLTPSTNPCDFGGSGWIMVLDAITGGSQTLTPFDINRDGSFGDGDKISDSVDPSIKVSLSGLSNGSMQGGVSLIDRGELDHMRFNDDDGAAGDRTDGLDLLGPDDEGRQSWQQLQ